MKGMALVQTGIKILSMSLPALGAMSPEGSSVITAIKSLEKHFGEQSHVGKQLIPAEMMNIMAQMPKQGA